MSTESNNLQEEQTKLYEFLNSLEGGIKNLLIIFYLLGKLEENNEHEQEVDIFLQSLGYSLTSKEIISNLTDFLDSTSNYFVLLILKSFKELRSALDSVRIHEPDEKVAELLKDFNEDTEVSEDEKEEVMEKLSYVKSAVSA
ncbi:MAG: hypothetical protein QXP88_00710 [Thermoproteota archaeon]